MRSWVAKHRGITHVMTSSNTPPIGSDPNTVLAAINRPVVYADPANDITNDVIHHLNMAYSELGKPADKPTAASRSRQCGRDRQPHAAGGAGSPANRPGRRTVSRIRTRPAGRSSRAVRSAA